MRKLTAFFFIVCACATSRSAVTERAEKPIVQSQKETYRFPTPRTETYINLKYRYSPKKNEIVLLSSATDGMWEILEVSLSNGEKRRYTIKGPEIDLKNVIPVEFPFDWERIVSQSCELRELRSKTFREGMLLISNSMCEDEFAFQ